MAVILFCVLAVNKDMRMIIHIVLLTILVLPVGSVTVEYIGAYQGFTSVPDAIPSNVTHIDLSDNNITTLSDGDFITYTNLTFLSVHHNLLVNVTPEAFLGTKLSILILNHNNLECMPSLAAIEDTLTELKVNDNDFSDCPYQQPIGNLAVLKLLDIDDVDNSGNLNLSGYYNSAPNLKELYIRGNNIASVPQDLPASLKTLKMSRNDFTYLENDIFQGMPSLGHLVVSNSDIADVSSGAFRGTLLTVLTLSKNDLVCLPSLETVNSTLKKLNVDQNSLHNPIFCSGELEAEFGALQTLHIYR